MPCDMATTRRVWRVLLADDDEAFREVVAESLRQHDFAVTECRRGVDLITQLRCLDEPTQREEFDLIITDIRMPGVTGLSILAGPRELPHAPPIILMTAFGDEATHGEARRLGASAIIDKPLEIAELVTAAERILNPVSEPSTSGPGGKES